MSAVPTARENLRRIIVSLFPWLPGVVAVAGARGKGLAIRAAGGLLHLAGGPDDPAVHRVGDTGTAGTVQATPPGPASAALTFINADGSSQTFAFTYVAPNIIITPITPEPFPLTTKATTGSQKVTCG